MRGGFSLHFFFTCLLTGLGRLGGFFLKRAFVWGASTARFIVPLLPTTFYILTLIFLMQWWELKPLCVGWGSMAFLFSFSKKNVVQTDWIWFLFFIRWVNTLASSTPLLFTHRDIPTCCTLRMIFIWDLRVSILASPGLSLLDFHYPDEISLLAFHFSRFFLGVCVECDGRRCGCGAYKQLERGKLKRREMIFGALYSYFAGLGRGMLIDEGAVIVNTDRMVIPLCWCIPSTVCMYGEVRRMAVDTEI